MISLAVATTLCTSPNFEEGQTATLNLEEIRGQIVVLHYTRQKSLFVLQSCWCGAIRPTMMMSARDVCTLYYSMPPYSEQLSFDAKKP